MGITYKSELNAIEEYWTLFESTGWNEEYRISQEDLTRVVGKTWSLVAAYDGERLVGFGRIVSDGLLHAMVYDLITDPEYQSKGIGAEVLRRLVDKCNREGIRDIQLFCARGKRTFYEKRGFRARDEESPGMEYVGTR